MSLSQKLWLATGTMTALLILCGVLLVLHRPSFEQPTGMMESASLGVASPLVWELTLLVSVGAIGLASSALISWNLRDSSELIREASQDCDWTSAAAAGFGAYRYDLESRSVDWSPELKRIHGLSCDVMPSFEQVLELIHPYDREHFQQRMTGVFTPPDGEPFECEFRIVQPDGTERWLRDRGTFRYSGWGSNRRPRQAFGLIVDITERKLNEEHEHESEARHRAAFEDSAVGMYQADPTTGRFRRVNRRFCQMIGYNNSELLSLTIAEVIHPDDRESNHSGLDRLRRGDISEYRAELRYVRKDGRILWCDVTMNQFQSAVDRTSRTLAVVKDITERKLAEETARLAEQRLRAFLENSSVCGWMKDEEGRYVFVSGYHRHRFGVKFDDWLGKTDFDLWPQHLAEEFRKNDQAVLASRRSIEFLEKAISETGTETWWFSHKFPFQDAIGKQYVGGLAVDVTDRILAEQDLQRTKDTLQAVVENAPSGIVVTDREGRFLISNPAMETFLGGPITGDASGPSGQYTLHRADGSPFPSDELPLVRALRGKSIADVEMMIRRDDGTQAIGLAAAAPLRDESGTIWGAIAVMRDITFQKHYEEALWRLNEDLERRVDARTEELTRTVSRLEVEIAERERLEREIAEAAELEQRRIGQDLHDSVGQQLTALTMLAQDFVESLQSARLAQPSVLASADSATSPPGLTGLGPVELAERLRRGLQQSLAEVRSISRNLNPVPVDSQGLMAALTDLIESVRPQSKVNCWFDCPAPVVVEDNITATHLYHIAQEALSNALRHAQARDIRIRLEHVDSQVVLRIEDDGVGIPRPLPAGTGLGQRTMQNRAAVIGATLTVEPRQPKGTRIQCSVTSRNHEQRPN